MRKSLMLMLTFLMSIMCVQSVSAQTAWTQGAVVSTGDYYIYNIGAQRFLNQGTSWGTHTIVDGAGQSINISGTSGNYMLHFSKVTGERYLGNEGWVDCETSRNDYSTWTFESVNRNGYTNVYKMKAVKGGSYLYWAGGSGYYGNEAVVGDASSITDQAYWILIPKTDRESYSNASNQNPVDMTYKIANPDFEGDVTGIKAGVDNNNNDIIWNAPNEWSGENIYVMDNGQETTVARFAEAWCGWWNTSADLGTWEKRRGIYDANTDRFILDDFDFYQTLSNLPAGKYRLSFTGKAAQEKDLSQAVEGVHFYAGSKNLYITSSQPQTYNINFVADETNSVKIGCNVVGTNANWVFFDNVRLTYYGPVAIALPNDNTTELVVGQWYYYDVSSFGQYNLEGTVSNIIYTQNGDNIVDSNPSTKSAQSRLILDSGRVYFQATAPGTTLKISSVSDEGINSTFTVASLNVDGLPTINIDLFNVHVNPDGRGSQGAKDISKYLMMQNKRYDLLAVQEDFNYNSELVSEFGNTYGQGTWRGEVGLGSILNPPSDTDGLNFFWNKDNGCEASGESWTRYTTSVSTEGNQYIKKGFRYYETTLADGLKVDVYITHMDAGDGDAVGSRNAQWTQLANAVIQNSFTTRPKIIMGDFNSRYTRENIITNFKNIVEATGNYEFHDVWIDLVRSGSYPNVGDASLSNEVVDKVIYLNPKATGSTQLTPLSYSRETDYTVGTVYGSSDNTALGDHGPIVVKFKAEKPAIQFNEVKDRWAWTGETITTGYVNWLLYNVHYGAYDSGKNGFLTMDGTLVRDPNLSNVKPFAFWGSTSTASISNDYGKVKVWLQAGSGYLGGIVPTSESGCEYNIISASESYALSTLLAYHFKHVDNDHYLSAKDVNGLEADENTSAKNSWALISPQQLAKYNRYCEAWDKGYTYLMYLPLDDMISENMTELLQRTGVRWTDTTTDELETLNAQIETWFDDDETDHIVNPSFELDENGQQLTTNAEYTNFVVPGWSVPNDVAEAFISNKNAINGVRNFIDVDGDYVYNTWGGSPANGYYLRQTISGLQEGFYKLKAVATTDEGNSISLQIGNTIQTTPCKASRPYSQHLEVPLYYHNGEGNLVIGAYSNTWFEIDDFRLYRYDYYYDETITSAEYATTAIRYNTDIPAGVEVYYVTAINPANGDTGGKVRNTIHLEKYNDTQLAAGEGVIIYKAGNDANRQFRFYRTNDQVDPIADNLLIGAVNRIEANEKSSEYTYYMLSKKTITYDKLIENINEQTGEVTHSTVETTEPVVGFYKLDDNVAIKAHKAYLRVNNNTSGVKNGYIFDFGDFDFDGETTGINKAETTNDVVVIGIYSVGGSRLGNLQKGMNIIRMSDGTVKKVLVK